MTFPQEQTHPFSHQQYNGYWTGQPKPAEILQQLNQQATSCPSLQCPVDQIQVQKPVLVVAINQMPDQT